MTQAAQQSKWTRERTKKRIEVELIEHAPFQHSPNRFDQESTRYQRLLEDVKRNGMITPVQVIQLPSGKYRLIDGHRRFMVCKQLGYRTVECIVCVPQAGENLTKLSYEVWLSANTREKITLAMRVSAALCTGGEDPQVAQFTDLIYRLRRVGLSDEKFDNYRLGKEQPSPTDLRKIYTAAREYRGDGQGHCSDREFLRFYNWATDTKSMRPLTRAAQLRNAGNIPQARHVHRIVNEAFEKQLPLCVIDGDVAVGTPRRMAKAKK